MGRFRLNKAFDARVQKLSLDVGHADLTAAATSQVLAIGQVPAGAMILGVRIGLATPFTGGGATGVTIDVGSTGNADALVDGADVLAAAVDGEASAITEGISPHKRYAAATTINATFASNVNVADLTAGACTIDLLYAVADEI